MFSGMLRRFRELVRHEDYVVSRHALPKLWSADLTAFDLEMLVLCGCIVERQRDRSSGEWKYVIEGTSRLGLPVAAIVKLSTVGKLVFITVYRL